MITDSEDNSAQPPQADKDDSSLNAHLWFPEPEAPEPVVAIPQASGSSSLLRDRLYIGNLHPTVDEYALLQVFTKFGKVSKLDFLFHKTGPNKGKPRGYAFLQYLHEGDAQTALESISGKLFRGRKLVVTFAHQAPLEQPGGIRQAGRDEKNRYTADYPEYDEERNSYSVRRQDCDDGGEVTPDGIEHHKSVQLVTTKTIATDYIIGSSLKAVHWCGRLSLLQTSRAASHHACRTHPPSKAFCGG
ncbi:uncharacterized protein EDB91DRAFT_1251160 [Suillus paluster]|uniref:uncharacterized protein n=1 Tax=Suillus paluster TaxID=48578 RepID=UPI001B86FF65|nr:uncharacterized protein EDB91DRAFT_1251160 [Suillus paluster]KAG1733852.1 hypothetical protein EDB91DRAFT_1251160 [Suillus paluster]